MGSTVVAHRLRFSMACETFPDQRLNTRLLHWQLDSLPLSQQGSLCCAVFSCQSCQALCNPMDWSPPGSSVHGDSPGQNTGVGGHAFLRGIFSTQGLNTGLLHCRWILYHLSHQGNPWILEWVAYPFSRGSSWLRNWTGVSCIASGFFTRASREAPGKPMDDLFLKMAFGEHFGVLTKYTHRIHCYM